jgi:hypothetical protein
MRVVDSAIPTRPMRLPPQVEAADHHLCRIDQAVVQSRKVARRESTGPMRLLQLPSQARVALGDPREREEALFKVMKQKSTVLQVCDRLSLGVQDSLDALDDRIAMGQEELKKFDMCVELIRHTQC